MMDKQHIASFPYYVDPPQSNGQGEVPLTLLVRWLLDSATCHAEQLDIGYSTLIRSNKVWVLARLAVEMTSYPKIREHVKVETWVEDVNKHFSTRNFCFSGDNGVVYGYARTVWSVIDLDSRTSVDLTSFNYFGQYSDSRECPIERPAKIRPVESEHPVSYRVKQSDIDLNRHVNSVKYIEHVLDIFPLQVYDENMISRFEINYISEARFGEELFLHCVKNDKEENVFEIKNNESGTLCRGKVILLHRN